MTKHIKNKYPEVITVALGIRTNTNGVVGICGTRHGLTFIIPWYDFLGPLLLEQFLYSFSQLTTAILIGECQIHVSSIYNNIVKK